MKTELILVEGVSDVQLISYYLQKVYDWKHVNENELGIEQKDEHEHIESLSKDDYQLVLCGVGGNGRFERFINDHRIKQIIIEKDITSIVIVTDRDEAANPRIERTFKNLFDNLLFKSGQWADNSIKDSFGETKNIMTHLLIIPESEKGALEKVVRVEFYSKRRQIRPYHGLF